MHFPAKSSILQLDKKNKNLCRQEIWNETNENIGVNHKIEEWQWRENGKGSLRQLGTCAECVGIL